MKYSEEIVVPYAASLVPEVGEIIVFAPHPDDEVFGCGGALLLHAKNGQRIQTILLTSGEGGCTDGVKEQYSKTRFEESKSAALEMGLPVPHCWDLGDRTLVYGEVFVQRIVETILASKATVIYAPSLWEAHPDHRAASMSVVEAVRRVGGSLQLWLYEVSAPLRPSKLIDISAVWEAKSTAMRCFKTQIANVDYPGFISALNRFRAFTLSKEVSFAEAFEVYNAVDLNRPTHSPLGSERAKLRTRGISIDPLDVPLVSVIVRTNLRHTLAAAINSVVSQTYRNIEIVLVDVGGTGLVDADVRGVPFPVRVASKGRPLSRPSAANAGLESASGQYCIFLDDDDRFHPDHLFKLVNFLVENPGIGAVHTGVMCVDVTGQPTGVVFDFPYAERELAYGNFMPIHGVMFRRKLLMAGCCFDEEFDVYEDWDFWLQLEGQTPFGFVPGVSAAYLIDALSGAGVRLDPSIANRATAQIYKKWAVAHSEAAFLELVTRALDRRNLLRRVGGLQSDIASNSDQISRLSATLSETQVQADRATHEANQARLDADHFRRAHERACRDRDVALAEARSALLQVTTARNECANAYVEVGLARTDAKNGRDAEGRALLEVDRLRARIADGEQSLEASRQLNLIESTKADSLLVELESVRTSLSLTSESLEKLSQQYSEVTAMTAVQAQTYATLLARQLETEVELGRVVAEAKSLSATVLSQAEELESNIQSLHYYRTSIDAIHESRSWRLTRPLRLLSAIAAKARFAVRAANRIRLRQHSLFQLISRTGTVLRSEGVRGFTKRLSPVINVTNSTVVDFQLPQIPSETQKNYHGWIESFDSFDEKQMQSLSMDIQGLIQRPLISIVMPVHNPAEEDLVRAIESAIGQVYSNWELCICDDASTDQHVHRVLNSYQARDSRIRVSRMGKNGHISRASNEAIAMASGSYVAFLDHDDELSCHALLRVVQYVDKHPLAKVFYSDEDKIDSLGKRFDPYFKCDFNLGLLRSHNYMCHFAVYEVNFLRNLGALQIGFEGAQDYDLALRAVDGTDPANIVHIPHILYHWRTAVGSTASGHSEKTYAFSAGQRALEAHYARRQLNAKAIEAPEAPGMYRTKWNMPPTPPFVSIVIPTRNGEAILRQCLDSLQRTTYQNYEILVIDNGSDEPATIQLLKDRAEAGEIKILRDDRPFNFSALNNRAVRELAMGEYVLLLNNDIEVMNDDWLSEMVGPAEEEGVGCVGARLWYPDGRLQHAGIILVCGVAGHAHKYLARGQHGYMGRAVLSQDMIGVTAACLLVKKDIYLEVGGLDEGLAVAFNDVDFCLKVQKAGYRNHFTPYAQLIHHESVTRGYEDTPEKQDRFRREIQKMQNRWPSLLAHSDPYYSPNLTAVAEDFSLAWPPRRVLP